MLRGFAHPGSSRAIQHDPEKTPNTTPDACSPSQAIALPGQGHPKHSSKQHHAEQTGSFHPTGGNRLQRRIPSAAQHVI